MVTISMRIKFTQRGTGNPEEGTARVLEPTENNTPYQVWNSPPAC